MRKKIITDEQKIASWNAYNEATRKHNQLKRECLLWVRNNHPKVWQQLRKKCGLE